MIEPTFNLSYCLISKNGSQNYSSKLKNSLFDMYYEDA